MQLKEIANRINAISFFFFEIKGKASSKGTNYKGFDITGLSVSFFMFFIA